MNPIRPVEWRLLQPHLFPGVRMLELGNKVNTSVSRSYKDFLTKEHGVVHTSVDWNGQDGALKLDLRDRLDLGEFDIVTNYGTTEHVSDKQGIVWDNIFRA